MARVKRGWHWQLLGQSPLHRREGWRFWQNVRRDPFYTGDGFSNSLAISQGSLRRGSAAVYLPISHPEIEEFIEIRRPTGGDPNRKAPNLHHGVLVPDAFMRAVENDEEWALLSPKDQAPIRKVSARALWIRLLTARVEVGEPYIVFSDQVNRAIRNITSLPVSQ